MPADMDDPAEYYKNVSTTPQNGQGNKAHQANGISEDTTEDPPGKSAKRSGADDVSSEKPSKQPRLEEDAEDVDEMKFPREVELMRFLGSRAEEIASLVKEVERKYPKLISQQVPRHMRRRAVSHDKRRLPKRLREKIAHEPDPPKSKRPSRKHRRRPRNLLADYARRQRRHVWLETHIWHAKRFKMADLWGYRIPLQPTDKGIRAAYRGSAKHVLVHDLSYFNCIELIGSAEELVSKLALITSADAGLTFGAKSYLPGTREGSVMLYRRGRYPFGAIGPVRFLWRPAREQTADGESAGRQLWLWVHPTIHSEVSEELVELFALQRVQVTPEGETTTTGDAKRARSESAATPTDGVFKSKEGAASSANLSNDSEKSANEPTEAKSAKAGEEGNSASQKSLKDKKGKKRKKAVVEGDKTKQEESVVEEALDKSEVLQLPVYTNGVVTMVQLKDTMTRFSLTGPLATAVVVDALSPSAEATTSEPDVWWNRRGVEREAQESGWKVLSRIGSAEMAECELPRVLGRTVRDPRVLLPTCKTKVTEQCSSVAAQEKGAKPLSPLASDSALWEPLVRDEVSFQKMSESQLNQLRSQNLVPGTLLELGDAESRIPVLAVRKEGSRTNLGFGSGWDVILPAGWGRPFWIALVYRGARASGLRELRSLSLEMGLPCFPFDHPDTTATQKSEEDDRRELMAKHLRYPPDKRPSFKKLRISCPFFFPWAQLIRDWRELASRPNADDSGDSDPTFYVLRSRKVLRRLSALFAEANKPRKKVPATAALKALEDIRVVAQAANLDLSRALVCVELSSCSKGVLRRFDSISAPTEEDLEAFRQDGFGDSVEAPCERLRKLRKPKDAKLLKKKAPKPTVEELLARPVVTAVVKECSRLLLGGVVSGDYCFSSACGRGLGYCALEGLVHLVRTSSQAGVSPVVLFRHQHSVQYRYATIRILEEC